MLKPLEDVLRFVRMHSEGEFLEVYPAPALTLWIPQSSDPLSESENFLQSTMEEEGFKNLFIMATGRNHVAWLLKSNRNFFQNIISLGRAPTNDVQIPLDTISKVHAVFTKIGDGWRLSDRGAKNGLFVNSTAVENGRTIDLKDGDVLRFGQEVEGTFYSGEALYRFLNILA